MMTEQLRTRSHRRCLARQIAALTTSLLTLALVHAKAYADDWVLEHAAPSRSFDDIELQPMPPHQRHALIVLLALDPAQQLLLDDLDVARRHDMINEWLPYREWLQSKQYAASAGIINIQQFREQHAERLDIVRATAQRSETAMFEDMKLILSTAQLEQRWPIAERWWRHHRIVESAPHANAPMPDLVLAFLHAHLGAHLAANPPEPEALLDIASALPLPLINEWTIELETAGRRFGTIAEDFRKLFEQHLQTSARYTFDDEGEPTVSPEEAERIDRQLAANRTRMGELGIRGLAIYHATSQRTAEIAERIANGLDDPQRARFNELVNQAMRTPNPSRSDPKAWSFYSPALNTLELIEHLAGERLFERPLPFTHQSLHESRQSQPVPTDSSFKHLTGQQRTDLRAIADDFIQRLAPLRNDFTVSRQDDSPPPSALIIIEDCRIMLRHATADSSISPMMIQQIETQLSDKQKQLRQNMVIIELDTLDRLRAILTIEQRTELLTAR